MGAPAKKAPMHLLYEIICTSFQKTSVQPLSGTTNIEENTTSPGEKRIWPGCKALKKPPPFLLYWIHYLDKISCAGKLQVPLHSSLTSKKARKKSGSFYLLPYKRAVSKKKAILFV